MERGRCPKVKDIRPSDTSTPIGAVGSNRKVNGEEVALREANVPYCLLTENILIFTSPQQMVKNRETEN